MGFFGKLFGGGSKSAPDDFWAWFGANANKFEGQPGTGPLEELSKRIKRAHPQLVFQIGRSPKHGGFELEISADGLRELVPIVTDLVGRAPAIAGWTIHAFRQPHPGLSVEMAGRTINSDNVFFDAQRNDNAVDLIVYIDQLDEAPDAFQHIGFLLLDATFGEYAVMTKIAGLDFVDGRKRSRTARPLTELAGELEQLRPTAVD